MTLSLLLASAPALGWNAAGHRLVAAIAWRQMSPEARQEAEQLLRRHPDYRKWITRAREDSGYLAFLEAATWADDIRKDRRFFDEKRETPTRPLPGLPDTARHKSWHYVDRHPDGRVREGELDHQLDRLSRLLQGPGTPPEERTYALPWVIHLVGDIHQPLHAGSRDDEGGNAFKVENPLNPRMPFISIHAWWDDLPGPPWLRGPRLEEKVDSLLAAAPRPPRQGTVRVWEQESRAISLDEAYPPDSGSLLPLITPEFHARAKAIAERRLVEAGYRLGHLLEENFTRVPRGIRRQAPTSGRQVEAPA